MDENEQYISKGAESFQASEDINESEEVIQHPDAKKPLVTKEERQKKVDEFNTLAEKSESEKEKRWYEIRSQVERIVDGLGKGIDEQIKEGVAAFMALEFPTSQSCDGHGIAGPWIEVYTDAPKGWQDSKEKKQEWAEANKIEKKKMQELINEFYTDRDVPEEIQLVIAPMGIFEAFRIENKGNEDLWEVLKKDQKDHELASAFKKEMDDFIDFLKEKYFSEKLS